MSTDSAHIAGVVQNIEDRIKAHRKGAILQRDTVEAIDIVHHAVTFVGHPRALELWREALWERRLARGAKQAIIEMLEYLLEAVARGEFSAVSRICDCLYVLLDAGSSQKVDPWKTVALSEETMGSGSSITPQVRDGSDELREGYGESR